jgi:hypothetical protein
VTEYDSLFRSVWEGDAPAEALADYVLDRLDDPTWLPVGPSAYIIASCTVPIGDEEEDIVCFRVRRDRTDSDTRLWCHLTLITLGWIHSDHFDRLRMSVMFAGWLRENMAEMKEFLNKRRLLGVE